jgi:phosphotransferase system HPr (HPr) family protein
VTESRAVELTNPEGLHARPATEIVQKLKALDAEVTIQSGTRRANVRSPISLLTLGARPGDEIVISASGPDATRAIDIVARVVAPPAEDNDDASRS